MIEPVDILGMGAEGPSGLSAAARARLSAATFLAGGRRHLELVESGAVETFAIVDNLAELVERLRRRGPGDRCVVLASGDPLCFGIGHRLGLELGRDAIRVEPALSSLQLAFARAGLSWHDAAIASVHGRPLAETLLPLLGRPKIGLFTQDGSSPSAVAKFFVDRGLDDYTAWVGERLGTATERVERGPILDLPKKTFDHLNFLILERSGRREAVFDWVESRPFVIPDHLHAQPDAGPVLLTHADVRSITLSRFCDASDGPIWDVGAGLGGVAVDLARAFPGSEVVAFERSEVQRAYLRENRLRFAAYNLRIVAGEAPECLVDEARPSAIFLGGSGGRLGPILDLAFDRLVEGGPLVANFVGLENLALFSERVRSLGWPLDVAQVQIWQGRPLAGLTTMAPLRPVWVVRTSRPGPRSN
jgi:precorrin-6B C5,15-methyltransferase / cobalt-precorrin-6B C5,C15-methyltransferase